MAENSCIQGDGGGQPDNEASGFAPNIPALRGIVDSAKSFLESVTQLVETSSCRRVPDADSELLGVCERLRAACGEIEPLVGSTSAAGTEDQTALNTQAPRMLVLGQPKSGKSSLINEILGKTALCQSQSPSFASQLALLRYSNAAPSSAAPGRDGINSPVGYQNTSDSGENSQLELPVLDVALPCEVLKQSGLEILDSPGSQDSPPVDAWGLSASPAIVVYVIDASSGFTREVERDINEIRFRYATSQLVFVLNKMDTCAEIAAARGVAIDMAQTAVRDGALAGLKRLGYPVAAPSETPAQSFGASPSQLFSLSCRWLRSVRRGRLRRHCDTDGADTRVWQESLRSLRVDVACGVGRRLRRLVTEVADRLDDTARLLGMLAVQLDNTDESKREAWENIVSLQQRSFRELQTCASLPDRMVAMLKEKGTKRQILESLRCLSDSSDEQTAQKSPQTAVTADIERQVFNLQLQFCQKFAEVELNNRLERLDEILGTLNAFEHPLPPTPIPELSREFSMSEGMEFEKLERTPVKKGKSKTLLRSVGIAKQRWRVDAAKEFMRSVDLSPAIRQSTDKLAALMHKSERDTNTAVSRANLRVCEFRDQLKVRRQGVIEQSREAVKLWLRLRSVITETQLLSKFHWDRRVCIAVGAHGSVVYRAAESSAADGTEGRSMAVKQIVLDDEQFSEMSSGLRYTCLSNSDSVLPIRGLVIKQLSSQPAIWKLHLWMDLLMEQSLQHQLPYLLEHKSLTERLGILLKTTESLMQVQSGMQQHGNLRLSNVFLCEDGQTVKLSDIGQARVDQRSQQLTLENRLCGPANGAGEASKIANMDVYCLGLILRAICYGISSSTKITICEDLNKLIEDSLHKLPDSRPKVSEVADRLKKIVDKPETLVPT